MKNRTIGKEPVLVEKMDRFHFPVNQHFVTNRYKNGLSNRGFWNPGYKMLGERYIGSVKAVSRCMETVLKEFRNFLP